MSPPAGKTANKEPGPLQGPMCVAPGSPNAAGSAGGGLLNKLFGMGYLQQSQSLKPGVGGPMSSGPTSHVGSQPSGGAGHVAERYALLTALKAVSDAPPIVVTESSIAIGEFAGWLGSALDLLTRGAVELDIGAEGMSEVTRASFSVAVAQGAHRVATSLKRETERLRSGVLALTNQSSVAKKERGPTPTLPTATEVKGLGASVKGLRQLAAGSGSFDLMDAKKAMAEATALAQDATLAVLQAQAVLQARTTWSENPEGISGEESKKSGRARGEIDELFKDAGFGSGASFDDAKNRIFDWCGIFVVASMFRSAGIDEELRAGYYHTANITDTFKYTQKSNATRAPASIWADGEWHDIKTYHEARGSLRRYIPKTEVAAPIAEGNAADIRPGDIALIDHSGGTTPSHIVMVESYDPVTQTLVTIEGNTKGIKSDANGNAERHDKDDEHFKQGAYGQTGTAIHVRDLTKTTKETQTKYPSATTNPPKDAYKPRSGSTVVAVCRPSFVDFEEHEYATKKVPEALRKVSPTELQTKSRAKDKSSIEMHTPK